MNNRYSWLICSVVLTIAAVGLWVAYEDYDRILAPLRVIGWQGYIFLCLFSLINYFLRFIRWNYLLQQLGDTVSGWDSWLCYLSGFAFTTTPAKAGEVVRCYYFNRRHKIEYAHTLAGLFCERVMDALAAVLIGVLALYIFDDVRWAGGLFTVLILVIVALVSHQRLLLRIVERFRVVRLSVLHKLLDLVPLLLARTNQLFNPMPFAGGLFLGVIAWSAEALAFAWLAQTLGGEGSVLLYMSIFCVSIVAGALTFIPGGLGGTEVVLYTLMVATGMGDAEALTATILIRLATLWFAVALGLLSMLWIEASPSSEPESRPRP
jgi:uncharacterized protein (TIRG00374 family)